MNKWLNVILWAALGFLLTSAGVRPWSWQYWAIIVCVACISINALLW